MPENKSLTVNDVSILSLAARPGLKKAQWERIRHGLTEFGLEVGESLFEHRNQSDFQPKKDSEMFALGFKKMAAGHQ